MAMGKACWMWGKSCEQIGKTSQGRDITNQGQFLSLFLSLMSSRVLGVLFNYSVDSPLMRRCLVSSHDYAEVVHFGEAPYIRGTLVLL